MKKKRALKRRPSGGRRLLPGLALLLGLSAGGLLALSPDLSVPVVILLLPGLVTLLLDRSPGLALARAMLLFQAAVAIGPVHRAYYACAGLHGCMAQLAQPVTVMTVWLAAGVAWVLTEMAPLALRLWEDAKLRARRAALERRRGELVAEWGLEQRPAASVAGGAPVGSSGGQFGGGQ